MLFKKIIAQYGKSLAGPVRPEEDVIAASVPNARMREFRRSALDAVSAASPYLLDANAAAYINSFHDSMVEDGGDGDPIMRQVEFMRAIDLPASVVWVEYDYRRLLQVRINQDPSLEIERELLDTVGMRGILIDDRDGAQLMVTMYRATASGALVDPTCRSACSRDPLPS